jgi:hypothetical protein
MAAALRAALVAGAAATACASATGPTAFAAISDWGGTNAPPYTTPAQMAVAGALETVVSKNNVEFVLSAGNNFMPTGLPGAWLARAAHCRGVLVAASPARRVARWVRCAV